MKPVSHNVGDFINMLKLEDKGIDRAVIFNKDGIRIASTCSIESLLDEPFCIHINNSKYNVSPPEKQRISSEDLSKLGNVRTLVAQLYEALHVGEYHIRKEKDLIQRLENLKHDITPLEEKRIELGKQALRKTNLKTWLGLGLMSVQFGVLARLTWWEYSWDIMEPVTYFVTYGTAMAAYAYFCITKQVNVTDRQYLLSIHKRAKKNSFDIEEYNSKKRQIAEVEFDLKRLRDPLHLQIPPHFKNSLPPPKRGSSTPSENNEKTESNRKNDEKSVLF
uniref:Calcium uniporter protein n=1 Tax=Megaselia scalaris TaxID=36166 RepID=T1GS30_MEGSC